MAHLLIIEFPGGNDADIARAALDRGDTFTFLTSDLSLYLAQPAIKLLLDQAKECIEVSSFEYEEIEPVVLSAHQMLPFDAVLCLLDIRLIVAARLAHKLRLRHVDPEAAALLRDKYLVRCRLAERGIAQPTFELAESNHDLKESVNRIGLPVLIKPADGYGSQNIAVIRYPDELDPFISPLEDMLPSNANYGLGVRANDRLLVERFMTGNIIGCDVLSANGRHRLLGIHEKRFFDPPSFAIRGSCFATAHPDFEVIEGYVQTLLTAVNFTWGATHIEIMLTSTGPKLIEINARLVGAKIARLVGYAMDRSIYSDLIDVHLGHAPGAMLAQTQPVYAVTRWIVSSKAGRLQEVQTPNCADPRIKCMEIMKSPGDYIRPPIENSDRIGYFMVCGESRTEVEHLAEDLVSNSRVIMQDSATDLSLATMAPLGSNP